MRLKEENFLLMDLLYFMEDSFVRIFEIEILSSLREKQMMESLLGTKVNIGNFEDISIDRHLELENLVTARKSSQQYTSQVIFSSRRFTECSFERSLASSQAKRC